ncbi:MAG: ABC transporter permease, partial [Halieaceae bacterium]|nr:ABC transporter permease [Halieaceae bacterium]
MLALDFKPVLLWSDALVFLLVIALTLFFYRLRKDPQTRERWGRVFSSRLGMVTFTVIMVYVVIALLDSLHFRKALPTPEGVVTNEIFYDNKVTSVLDVLLDGMGDRFERTYSAPFALKSFEKSNMKDEQGNMYRGYEDLKHAGQHLSDPQARWANVLELSLRALAWGLLAAALVVGLQWYLLRGSVHPWYASWAVQAVVICLFFWLVYVSRYYHVLGTDQGGADVAYQSIKGVRTGVLLGTLSTLVMLPIAVSLGVMAGYFKGWVDDVVQYLYTTLSSVPNVLLIAACVLMVQVALDKHPE